MTARPGMGEPKRRDGCRGATDTEESRLRRSESRIVRNVSSARPANDARRKPPAQSRPLAAPIGRSEVTVHCGEGIRQCWTAAPGRAGGLGAFRPQRYRGCPRGRETKRHNATPVWDLRSNISFQPPAPGKRNGRGGDRRRPPLSTFGSFRHRRERLRSEKFLPPSGQGETRMSRSSRCRPLVSSVVTLILSLAGHALAGPGEASTIHLPPPPPPLGLADLEQLSLQYNPTLAQSAAGVEASRGKAFQAGLCP